MEKYFQFKERFLKDFTNSTNQGRPKSLIVSIFYSRIQGDERCWHLAPNYFTGEDDYHWNDIVDSANPVFLEFYELKKRLAYVYLVDIALNSTETMYVNAAVYHLNNTLKFYLDFSQFPLSEIKAAPVGNALNDARDKNFINALCKILANLPDFDLQTLKPELQLLVVNERIKNRHKVPDLEAYVSLAYEYETGYELLVNTVSFCELDLVKLAKVLTIDKYRRGIAFELSKRKELHFTDGWAIVFKTLLEIDMQILFLLSGSLLRVPTFANEFISSDLFPKFLNQAVDYEKNVNDQRCCYGRLKKIKGDSWFVNEIYLPNKEDDFKWMEIIEYMGLDPENEDVKGKVVPRIFDLLKSGKNFVTILKIIKRFAESSQFCDENIHWLPIIFRYSSSVWGLVQDCVCLMSENSTCDEIIPLIEELEPRYEFYDLPLHLLVFYIELVGTVDIFNKEKLHFLVRNNINLKQYEPIIETINGRAGYWNRGEWKPGKYPYWRAVRTYFENDIDRDALNLLILLCENDNRYERLYPQLSRHLLELDDEELCLFAFKTIGKKMRKEFYLTVCAEGPGFIQQHPNLAPYLRVKKRKIGN